jgi:hypothetical protein
MPEALMDRLAPFLRWIIGAVCLAIGASAVVLAGAAASASTFNWILFGFEAITLMAGIFGVGVAWRGRARDVPLALTCLAGSVFVATVLGYIGTNPKSIGPFALRPWVVGRFLGVGLLTGVSVVVCLGRDGRAWGRLVRGVLLGLPLVALGAVFGLARTRDPIVDWLGTLPGAVIAIVGVLGFILVTLLLASSVHLTIQAFARAGERPTP